MKILKSKLLCVPMALLAGMSSAAMAAPIPGFWQLETDYRGSGSLLTATQALNAALPVGTDMMSARQSLQNVGATCKPAKHDPNSIQCLIRHVFLIDDAATVIRWTVVCHADDGEVAGVDVDRYVDRHRRG